MFLNFRRFKLQILLLILLVCAVHSTSATEASTIPITLDEAIARAQEKSPAAQSAKHELISAHWQYRYYRANYLPSVVLSSTPSLNSQINKITLNDGTSIFVKQNQLNTDIAVTVNQNIALTGGTVFIKSALARIDEFKHKTSLFNSIPMTIGYQQSLFGYNSLKWEKRIEPVKYRQALKKYNETMELVAARTCQYFFSLVEAQTNLDLAKLNFASADTLYRMAQGRYKIGTINENDMLQLEINRLNEETACMDAEVQLHEQTQILASYLGYDDLTIIEAALPDSVPDLHILPSVAMEMAMENASDPDYYALLKLESDSKVAQAKANSGLKADIYLQLGLSQSGPTLSQSYKHPHNQEYASISLSLPILDWGRGKGKVKVAKSQRDLAYTTAEQGMNDFRRNLNKMVMQFNMQAKKVDVAFRAHNLASHRYEISRRLYIAGRNTILDLNNAISEKDSAARSYITSIKTFWTLYYTIRSIAGSEIMK